MESFDAKKLFRILAFSKEQLLASKPKNKKVEPEYISAEGKKLLDDLDYLPPELTDLPF